MDYMKYLIVTLIKGEASRYQQKLLYSVAEKFNVNDAVKTKPPAHITLKYSFEVENIKPIEECIEQFCKSQKKCKYKLAGINHFDDDVIFIDVFPSNDMKKLYINFIQSLKNNTSLEFKEFDGKTNFHSSIAHTDIKDKFDEIYSFVSKENPIFDVLFDNISILKLADGVWKIHKEYPLN